MFRRLPHSLPQDPVVPTTLEDLGYFINENDQVRMIKKPDQKFQYRINRSDRVNDAYKEAVNACIRQTVSERLLALHMEVLRLPIGADSTERHVPIYVSKDIQHKKRVVVIFGERNQDLGILSFRSIGENGIKIGSVENLVRAIVEDPNPVPADELPGLIIANPGQLIWCQEKSRAIGYGEYLNIPRKSAVHGPFRIDPIRNRVPGNTNYPDHVQYIFENVMTGVVQHAARFDIIGLEYTGDAVIHYLAEHWNVWRGRVNGICLGNPQFKLSELNSTSAGNEFAEFLGKRARAYFVSDKPIESPLPGRSEYGCNCYASGEELYEDGILVKSWTSMLDWFNMVNVVTDYEEPVFSLSEESGDDDKDLWLTSAA